MHMTRPGSQAAKRSQIDDPTLSLAQVGLRRVRYEEWAANIHAKDGIPLSKGKIFEGNCFIRACIVYQNVQAAQFGHRPLHRGADALRVGDIATDRQNPDAELFQFFDSPLDFFLRAEITK